VDVEGGTAGFYRHCEPWDKYMSDREQVVCDDCLHNALDYQADYPSAEPPVQTFYHAILVDRTMTPVQKWRWLERCKEKGLDLRGLKSVARATLRQSTGGRAVSQAGDRE